MARKASKTSNNSSLPEVILGTELPDDPAPFSPSNSRRSTPASHQYPDPNPLPTIEPTIEPQPIQSTSERVNWTIEMTEALVETIYGVFKAGKAADNGFKKEAWLEASNAVIRVYQGPIGVGISASQCKNKWGDLKEKWKHWLVLSKQSGFG